jgi:hypothetical protein
MNQIIINFIVDYFYYVFLILIIFNFLIGRRKTQIHKKRMAILYFTIFIFLLYIYAQILKNNNLTDIYLILYFAIVIPVYIIFKNHLFPFQLRCKQCNKFLSFDRIMYTNYNKCKNCEPPIEDEKKDQK